MKTNLIFGLFLLTAIFSLAIKGKCDITESFSIPELLPQNTDNRENPEGIVSTDTIFLFEDTSSIVLDTIQFELFTGGKVKHILVLNNISDKDLPLNISIEYGPQNNYALEFNGIDGFVNCGSDSSLNIEESITIEAWVYPIDWFRNKIILHKGKFFSRYSITSGKDSLLIFKIMGDFRSQVKTTLPLRKKWTHIAAVYNYVSGILQLYYNGKKVSECINIFVDVPPNDYPLFIGASHIPLTGIWRPHLLNRNFFNGYLDEIKIWKTVRTEQQIRQYMKTELLKPEPDLMAYWKFNEGSGDTVFDASLSHNQGILSNGVDFIKSTSPVTIEWISVDQEEINIMNHNISEVLFNIDASGLNNGIYRSNIVFTQTEDSLNKIVVPVKLRITSAPDIVVLADTIKFQDCSLGETVKQSFTIFNAGFEPLKIKSLTTAWSNFSLHNRDIILAPYGSKTVEINYTPSLLGKPKANLQITSNDPDQSIINVPLFSGRIFLPQYLLFRWILVAVCIIIFFFFLFFYSRYRIKQKSSKQLTTKVNEALENHKKQQQIIIQQSRLTSLGQMAAGIAHEINQPLQNILLSAESLQIELVEPGYDKEYLKSLIKEQFHDVDRINQIAGNIDFFTSRKDDYISEPFDINICIKNVYSMMKKQFENHKIQTVITLNKKIANIHGDPVKFEQVVVNMLNNARDAVDEKGEADIPDYRKKVEVITGKLNSHIFMEIIDNGIGIPEENLTNIFLPFFTTKKLGKGTGLGLSISYGFIRDLNGNIEISSKQNAGTKLTISIPLNG